MKIAALLLLAISAFFCASSLLAEQRFEYSVKVVVDGDDELASELRKNLRAIPDVVVTETAPRDVIRVVAQETRIGGRPTGIVAAVLVTDSPTDVKQFWKTLGSLADCTWKGSPDSSWVVGASVADRISIKKFSIFSGPHSRSDMARRIVAALDNEVIEVSRQSYADLVAKGLIPK